jgi:hypothetical protein
VELRPVAPGLAGRDQKPLIHGRRSYGGDAARETAARGNFGLDATATKIPPAGDSHARPRD